MEAMQATDALRKLSSTTGQTANLQFYTEDVPGVARGDPLFVLLRRVILRSCTAWHGNSWAQ